MDFDQLTDMFQEEGIASIVVTRDDFYTTCAGHFTPPMVVLDTILTTPALLVEPIALATVHDTARRLYKLHETRVSEATIALVEKSIAEIDVPCVVLLQQTNETENGYDIDVHVRLHKAHESQATTFVAHMAGKFEMNVDTLIEFVSSERNAQLH